MMWKEHEVLMHKKSFGPKKSIRNKSEQPEFYLHMSIVEKITDNKKYIFHMKNQK